MKHNNWRKILIGTQQHWLIDLLWTRLHYAPPSPPPLPPLSVFSGPSPATATACPRPTSSFIGLHSIMSVRRPGRPGTCSSPSVTSVSLPKEPASRLGLPACPASLWLGRCRSRYDRLRSSSFVAYISRRLREWRSRLCPRTSEESENRKRKL